jgi:hypothetical protein
MAERTAAELIKVRQATLAGLRAQIGLHWQDVQGELHLQNREMPTWILLYTDSDPAVVHQVFCKISAPFMPRIAPLQFTVSYHILTLDTDITVEGLMDNDEILMACQRPHFGGQQIYSARRATHVFGQCVSGPRPSPA